MLQGISFNGNIIRNISCNVFWTFSYFLYRIILEWMIVIRITSYKHVFDDGPFSIWYTRYLEWEHKIAKWIWENRLLSSSEWKLHFLDFLLHEVCKFCQTLTDCTLLFTILVYRYTYAYAYNCMCQTCINKC